MQSRHIKEIDAIIIHCSASDRSIHDFKAIKKRHIETYGWDDIGYNYVIDWDGDTHTGRDLDYVGSHCLGQNRNSIGVCLLGHSHFTLPQLVSLRELFERLTNILLKKQIKVYPHNYFDENKLCPNIDMAYLANHALKENNTYMLLEGGVKFKAMKERVKPKGKFIDLPALKKAQEEYELSYLLSKGKPDSPLKSDW